MTKIIVRPSVRKYHNVNKGRSREEAEKNKTQKEPETKQFYFKSKVIKLILEHFDYPFQQLSVNY